MRNSGTWSQSKFIWSDARARYMPNPAYVPIGSRWIAELQIEPYEGLIRRYAKGRLWDCGCGDVPYYGLYRELVDDVVCTDWGGSEHGTQHVDRFVDLNLPVPFDDDAFDCVLLADVLEHVAAPQSLLRELRRVTRRQGHILIMVPFLYWLHEAPHDYFRYSQFGLRELCEGAGLEVLHLTSYGGRPDVIADLVNKSLADHPALCRLFLGAWRRASRSGLYQRERARTQDTFPLGYCLAATPKEGLG